MTQGSAGKKQVDWWRRKKLPQRGTKLCIAHPKDQQPQNDQAAERRKGLLKVSKSRRATKIKSLAIGEWHRCVNMVRIVQPKGKWLASMGFERDGAIWIFAEEAIFLVECGAIILKHVTCGKVRNQNSKDMNDHDDDSDSVASESNVNRGNQAGNSFSSSQSDVDADGMDHDQHDHADDADQGEGSDAEVDDSQNGPVPRVPEQQIQQQLQQDADEYQEKHSVAWCKTMPDKFSTPMSMQRAYATILTTDQELRMCFLYGHLRRSGYVARRPRPVDRVETLQIPYLCFSVWQHGKFRGRKQCGKPEFHVIMLTQMQCNHVVMESVMNAAAQCLPVAIKLAVVERSAVMFYDVTSVERTPLSRTIAEEEKHLLNKYRLDKQRVVDDEVVQYRAEEGSDDDDAGD